MTLKVFQFVWMYLHIVVLQTNTVHGVNATAISEQCRNTSTTQLCFTLYEFGSEEGANWSTAYDHCQEANETLAIIPDEETQKLLRMVGSDMDHNATKAWVAGRLSEDNTWIRVDGQRYTGTVSTGADTSTCSQLQWAGGHVYTLAEAVCTEPIRTYTAVCQYEAAKSVCDAGDQLVHGLCYNITYTAVHTWYEARMLCRMLYPGGTLAFVSITNTDLLQYLSANRPAATDSLWVGVYRRPWHWVTGAADARMTQTMSYYDWINPQTVTKADDSCVFVDFRERAMWDTGRCTLKYKYFVCQKASTIESGTSHGFAESTSRTESPESSVPYCGGYSPEETQAQYIMQLYAGIIAAVVIAVLVVIVVPVVVAVVYRKKTMKRDLQYRRNMPANPDGEYEYVSPRTDNRQITSDNDVNLNPTTAAPGSHEPSNTVNTSYQNVSFQGESPYHHIAPTEPRPLAEYDRLA